MSQILEYGILNSFVLREPFMPVSLFADLISDREKVSDEDLMNILKDPQVEEALFLASHSFWNRIEKWKKNKISGEKENEKIKLSILKYIARFCTRSTPFGLFAGCSLERFGSNNKYEGLSRKTELDANLIGDILQKVNESYSDNPSIRFCANNTIIEFYDKYRYLKPIQEKGKTIFVIEEVSKTDELSKILIKAKYKKNIEQLCASIVDKEISVLEARQYIDLLIREKLLLPELQIPLTGENWFSKLLPTFKKSTHHNLNKLNNALNKLDQNKVNGINDYEKVIELTKKLDFDIKSEFSFHVTSFKTNSFELNHSHKRDFLNALKIQRLLSQGNTNGNLENFKTQFKKKFKSRSIKLLKALDPDYGIDYLSINNSNGVVEIFDGIKIVRPDTNSEIRLNQIELKVSRIIANAIQKRKREIELSDKDFVDFKQDYNELADTFSGIFEIIKTEKGNLVRLKNLGGASGLNLISRFTKDNIDFKCYAKKISEIEDALRPNQIIAEIIHLPDNRLANILKRESYRSYEIPVFTNSYSANIILLEDLSISMKNGKLILISDSLNREVVPRLSTAHNFTTSNLPVYRFLCDLQTQDLDCALSPNFSFLSAIFPFIPRITYKGVIVSPAIWELQEECFKVLFDSLSNSEILLKKSKILQKENNLPKLVLLIQNDNEILVNLDNIDCIKYFLQLIKNRSKVLLQEFLFDLETYKNKSPNFANEIVVTFYKNRPNE